MTSIQKHSVWCILAGFLVMCGCQSPRSAERGVVQEARLQPGEQVGDFTYVDEQGEECTFADQREEVTIVTFPEPTTWPKCDHCRTIHALATRVDRPHTRVAIFSIGTTIRPKDGGRCNVQECVIEGRAKLTLLCDPNGQIAELFGTDTRGRFFVIGHRGQVVGTGKLGEMDRLEAHLRSAVASHESFYEETHKHRDDVY